MRRTILVLVVVVGLVGGAASAASAYPINGVWAVRQIKRTVKEDCYSYPGFRCLGWSVWHCYKLGRYKVRCRSEQEYMHRGNWRECRFNTVAKEEKHTNWVHFHFGSVRCYSESGAEIR